MNPPGAFNFEPPSAGPRALPGSPRRSGPRHGRRMRRSPTALMRCSCRVRRPPDLLPAAAGPPHGPTRADEQAPIARRRGTPPTTRSGWATVVAATAPGTTRSRSTTRPTAPRGLIAFYFDRIDRMARGGRGDLRPSGDPYHRLDRFLDPPVRVRTTVRCWRRSSSAVTLFESNLPPRWYLPREDVEVELPERDSAHDHPLPLQGPRELLLDQARRRRSGRPRPGLVLLRPR